MLRKLKGSLLLMICLVLSLVGCQGDSRSSGSGNPASGMTVATLVANPRLVTTTVIPPTPTIEDHGPFITMVEDFSDPGTGWEVSSNEYGSAGYEQGGYLVKALIKNEYYWGVANGYYTNIRIEVDATVISGPASGNDTYGVDCRVQENGDGYGFRISSDGYYSISKYIDSQGIRLVDWVKSDLIYTDGRSNSLTIICQDKYLSMLINGEFAASAEDETYTRGDISLSAASFEEEPISVLFDNVTVQEVGSAYEAEDFGGSSITINNPTDLEVCYVYISSSAVSKWGNSHLQNEERIIPGSSVKFEELTDGLVDISVRSCGQLRLFEEYEIDITKVSEIDLAAPEKIQEYTFASGEGWTSGVVYGGLISIRDGDYYSITAKDSEKVVSGYGADNYNDLMVFTDATLIDTGNENQGIYGVMCRADAIGNGILFAARGDGSGAIIKIKDGELQYLVDWIDSVSILPGVNSNYIEGNCSGSNYSMYVNGDFIASAVDPEWSSGQVGLAVIAPQGSTTVADFDFVQVYVTK